MSERRTFGDLRKYKGGKELERWEFEQRAKPIAPKNPEPPGEQGRIPGTEVLSPRPGMRPKKRAKR